MARVLSWIMAVVVGGVYGVAGTIGHSLMWGPVPVGLIVGGIACGAILVAVRTLTHDRGAAIATGAGMLGLLFVISQRGPGGSVVVPDALNGQIWMYIVVALVILVIAWPSLSRLPVRAVAGEQGEDTGAAT